MAKLRERVLEKCSVKSRVSGIRNRPKLGVVTLYTSELRVPATSGPRIAGNTVNNWPYISRKLTRGNVWRALREPPNRKNRSSLLFLLSQSSGVSSDDCNNI